MDTATQESVQRVGAVLALSRAATLDLQHERLIDTMRQIGEKLGLGLDKLLPEQIDNHLKLATAVAQAHMVMRINDEYTLPTWLMLKLVKEIEEA